MWQAPTLQMGIQPEKWGARKKDMGESVFPETDPISLFFRFAYIPFVLGVLHQLLAMRPADILQPFLFDNQKTYFAGGIFLKPGTTL